MAQTITKDFPVKGREREKKSLANRKNQGFGQPS